MGDTLAVAVSQSGTTTDTNRTVDLLRGRGAAVLAIVDRDRTTSPRRPTACCTRPTGTDVEMSVASTRPLYAQVAAGMLLACAITEAARIDTAGRRHELLTALRTLPDAMRTVLARREVVADAAHGNPLRTFSLPLYRVPQGLALSAVQASSRQRRRS